MKTNPKRSLSWAPFRLMVLLGVLLLGGSSIAAAGIDRSRTIHPSRPDPREQNIAKIQGVLEDRGAAPEVAEKVKDKLLTMSDKQIKLIVSLADLVGNDRQTAGADITLFVITILIVGS
jgi:hypothetical protein